MKSDTKLTKNPPQHDLYARYDNKSSPVDFSKLQRNVGVYAFVINPAGEVLTLLRNEYHKRYQQVWTLPGGKMEHRNDEGRLPIELIAETLPDQTGLTPEKYIWLGQYKDQDENQSLAEFHYFIALVDGIEHLKKRGPRHSDAQWKPLQTLSGLSMLPFMERFLESFTVQKMERLFQEREQNVEVIFHDSLKQRASAGNPGTAEDPPQPFTHAGRSLLSLFDPGTAFHSHIDPWEKMPQLKGDSLRESPLPRNGAIPVVSETGIRRAAAYLFNIKVNVSRHVASLPLLRKHRAENNNGTPSDYTDGLPRSPGFGD